MTKASIFLLLSLFLLTCKPNVSTHLSIQTHSPTYPILTNKAANPVLRIDVLGLQAGEAFDIGQIKIDLDGTTELTDIESAVIYFTDTISDFNTTQHFAKAEKITKVLQFNGNQTISHDSTYFWLSLSLNDNANLLHKITAKAVSITIDGNTQVIENQSTNTKKLGHALRKHNDDGIHTYRIPGLVTTNEGTLIAVYDNRKNSSVDLQEDVDIGMNRSTDGGQTWSPMKVIMDMGEWGGKPEIENGIGDPSILVDRQTNTIWVAAIWAHGHPGKRNWFASKPGLDPEQTSQLMLAKSEDDGLSWSEPINITQQVKDPKWHLLLQGPGKGITMKDGTLVFPAQYKDENELPHSTILYSKDRGQTWQLGTGAKPNTTEAQVVQLADGTLMLNMRDNRGNGDGRGTGTRAVAITKDMGKTWEVHPSSDKALIEPVCNASLIKHQFAESGQSKEILLFVNPNDQYQRRNMTIKVSEDEGMTWSSSFYTLLDEGQGRGYPSMTSIDENTIGILYEGSQADLVFQKLSIKELMKQH